MINEVGEFKENPKSFDNKKPALQQRCIKATVFRNNGE
jgi:hypothetical protein